MKKIFSLLVVTSLFLFFLSCKKEKTADYDWVKKGIDVAAYQLKLTSTEIADSAKLPRSIWVGYDMDFLSAQLEIDATQRKDSLRIIPAEKIGQRRLCSIYDWTSGFFPGSLWYTYELTGDKYFEVQAAKFTNLLNPVREYTGTHDLGFMIYCSYGNAERLAPNDTIPSVMIQTANNLADRFDDKIGCIRSWNFGTWNFPVIIDNMMNLELLFWASEFTKNPKYKDIAIKHANTTMKHHFRPDMSSYHVISYNSDGTVEKRETHQGKNDESAWARGQAWAFYGYVVCYRATKDQRYLDFAKKIADFMMERVKTEDLIPLWDYDAPNTPQTPRDASAASITASGMLEFSTLLPDGQKYFNYGETILKNLSSDAYLAKEGENQGFILMHSTGSLPHGSEIDTPLNYADYYYMEGLQRYMKLKGITYKDL